MRIDLDKHTSTIVLSDLAEAVAVAREVIDLFEQDTAWWRGHAHRDWPLQAQVFRPDPEHPDVRRYNEAALIGHFVSRAPTRSHRACPPPDDYFGWLFLAQHYGLPTCLLDWTENPLIALYFAVTEHKDEDGCLWSLWPGGLNRALGASSGLVQIRDREVVKIAEAAFHPGESPGNDIVAIDGQEIDPRMLAQMSRFTLHSSNYPMDLLSGSDTWLRRYMIRKEAKDKIRKQLSAMGIRRSNIFPDLASLAAELKDARFD